MALYVVILVGSFLSRIVPRSLRYLIGSAVGHAVYVIWARKRVVLRDNMATVLGMNSAEPQVKRLALKSMRNYCKYLVEFLELPVLSRHDKVIENMRIDGVEHLQAALAKGAGVILATAHFGTIEVPGLRLTDYTDFHAVYDSFSPAYLDKLIQRQRMGQGIDLIPVNNIRRMLRVLSGGGTLAMLFDRPVEIGKGVPVRYFGRETAVPGGPAVLALKTGATILPVYTVREPDKSFTSLINPPLTWTSTGERDRDVQTIMQKLMNTLQAAVHSRPDQWYMFRPMWPDMPSALPSGNLEPTSR
ncbi:MAG: lysophospholipid acyltransferase family protein [Chloroflexota bacterium]